MNYCSQSPGEDYFVQVRHAGRVDLCRFFFRSVDAKEGLGRSASEIARSADRVNVERLAVIPMVVVSGSRSAINTNALGYSAQEAKANRHRDELVRAFPRLARKNFFARIAQIRLVMTNQRERGPASIAIPLGSRFDIEAAVTHLHHHPRFFGLAARRAAWVRLGVIPSRDGLDTVPPDVRAKFRKREARIQFHDQFAELVSRLAFAARAVIQVVNVHTELLGERLALSRLGFQKVGAKVHVATGKCLDRDLMIDQKGLRSKPFWMFINLFHAGNFEA